LLRFVLTGDRLFGYDQGVTGGLLDLPSFTKYFPEINPLEPGISKALKSSRSTNQGIAVAAYNLGCFLGAIITIFIGNPLGRRKTIFYGSIVMTIGAILQCTSYALPQFIVGRIVTGFGNGMNTSTVPTWQSETAQSHERGKLVMIEGMLITAGICLSYWIDYGMCLCVHAHGVDAD
jgi:MFS family permease